MEFTSLEEMKKAFRKQCREKKVSVRIDSNKVTLTIDGEAVKSKLVNSGQRTGVFIVEFEDHPGLKNELLSNLIQFYLYKAEMSSVAYLAIESKNKQIQEFGFTPLNGKYYKALNDTTFIDAIRSIHEQLAPLKEEDPLFTYNIRTRNLELTLDFVYIEFYKTGVKGVINLWTMKSGEPFHLSIRPTDHLMKFHSLDEFGPLVREWMDEIYRKNRLTMLYESPKMYFNKAMASLGIYGDARDKIYEEFSRKSDPEEIEMNLVHFNKNDVHEIVSHVKNRAITLFQFEDFWAVYDTELAIFTEKTEAIKAFEKRIIDCSFSKNYQTRYNKLKEKQA